MLGPSPRVKRTREKDSPRTIKWQKSGKAGISMRNHLSTVMVCGLRGLRRVTRPCQYGKHLHIALLQVVGTAAFCPRRRLLYSASSHGLRQKVSHIRLGPVSEAQLRRAMITNGLMEYVAIPWQNHSEDGSEPRQLTVNLGLFVVHVLAGNSHLLRWSYYPATAFYCRIGGHFLG